MKIGVPMARAWSLQIPPVIRYLEEKYVADFFRDGSLMLSTLSRCKDHEDEVRRDADEGSSTFQIVHGNHMIGGMHDLGEHSYILCGSTNESAGLMDHFNADNYIKINNVLAFSEVISRWVPGFSGGKLGTCTYRDGRLIKREASHPVQPDPTELILAADSKDEVGMERAFRKLKGEMAMQIDAELEDAPYFIKDSTFANESEFRMVWQTPIAVEKPLHIKCPEVLEFCEPGIHTKELKGLIAGRTSKLAQDHMTVLSGLRNPEA